jgi:uncharacterized membrane protein|tara:strand:- start:25 stop:390 length:366 start_codon:yes stop_codon:yes gene_type:complete
MIQIHTALALAAVALTIAIFSLKKGSSYHRVMGWTWVIMMASVAISSFWINTIKLVGPFSPIHLLSIFVLWSLFTAVRAARSHRVADHKRNMQRLAFGALLIAGAFTFLPGRLMNAVLLGS